MRILVTGGAGFIGSHVADRYIELGHQVAVLDDLSSGKPENVNPRAKLFRMSLLDERLAGAFDEFRPEVVSHHAAQVNVRRSVDAPEFDATVNVVGSVRLFQAAAAHGCGKVIYASSGGACYGDPPKLPAREDTRVRPLCPYGVSKYAAEKYLELFGLLNEMRFTVLRYANVYGPRQDSHGEAGVVAIFSELLLEGKTPTIFGDGTKTRDYVFVSDIVQANVLALDAGDGGAFNVGTGREVSDDQVFAAVRDAVGVKIEAVHSEFRKGEVQRIALDASRIRDELGWRPRVAIEQGIPKAVEFYRSKRGRKPPMAS
ncbi:MAG: NAD-dependent epimerase/dehydratase family protein [Candidatus Brocadiia bacterium]|jgi:UDP-glucose 4-epimerase